MIDLYYEFDKFDGYDGYLHTGQFILKKFNEWGRKNCSHYFVCDVLGKNIRCSFVDEADAMGFKLRWL